MNLLYTLYCNCYSYAQHNKLGQGTTFVWWVKAFRWTNLLYALWSSSHRILTRQRDICPFHEVIMIGLSGRLGFRPRTDGRKQTWGCKWTSTGPLLKVFRLFGCYIITVHCKQRWCDHSYRQFFSAENTQKCFSGGGAPGPGHRWESLGRFLNHLAAFWGAAGKGTEGADDNSGKGRGSQHRVGMKMGAEG